MNNYGRIDENGNVIIGLPAIWKNNGKTLTNLAKMSHARLLHLGFFEIQEDIIPDYTPSHQILIYGKYKFNYETQKIYRDIVVDELSLETIEEQENVKKTEQIAEIIPQWKQIDLLAQGIYILYLAVKPYMNDDQINTMEYLKNTWLAIKDIRED